MMHTPRYEPGQTVQVAYTRVGATPAGRYKVVCALPSDGGARRYRVKGETENCERVVDERVMALPL